MKLFRQSNRTENADTRRVYAYYELAYTAVDFAAALAFTIGSVLFFWEDYGETARWAFLVGSILFIGKPTIRLAREIRLMRMGYIDHLAKKIEDS